MSDKCSSCSSTEFMAERIDAFTSANSLLKNAGLTGNDQDPPYTVGDVMTLSRFLLGMDD